MAIITKATITKGTPAIFTLNITDLLAHPKIDASAYWKITTNWSQIYLQYKSSGGQKKIVAFAPVDGAQGTFQTSVKADNIFNVVSLIINDLDGASFVLSRSELVAADFDVEITELKTNLVAYYKFDYSLEDSGPNNHDSYGRNNFETGKFGGGFYTPVPETYSGAKVDNHADFDFGTGPMSISFWFQPSINANRAYSAILGNVHGINDLDTTYVNNIAFWLYGTRFNVSINSGYGVYQWSYDGTATVWSHLILTRDNSGNCNFYINGSKYGSTYVFTGQLGLNEYYGPFTPRYFTVGSLYGFEAGQGVMDEVAIWKGRALSQSDITSLYNGGTGLEIPL